MRRSSRGWPMTDAAGSSKKALSIYLMCGRETPALAEAAVEGGADLLELGFPFSDPLADGPVVRRAGEKALAEGMRTAACLDVLRRTRERLDVPLIPMTYASLLEAYGWERFAADAREAGATSLIVADLPAGEHPELKRVQLVAPTSTDARLRVAAAETDGWLYLVTVTGTTGAREGVSPALAGLVERARAVARRAAVRRLRHLDAGASAHGGAARGRRRRGLARRRGRRGRAAGAPRVRRRASRSARPVRFGETRRPPRLSCVLRNRESGLQVDPPDLGFKATAVRLLRVWREQWRLVAVGLTMALATTGLSLAIAILIRHAIDDSIAPVSGERQRLWPYVLIVVVLSAIRFGTNFTRRYATARVGIRVEARMRELLYQAYLRFPRAFYDQHATGPGRVARDERPVPHSLLHRLGNGSGRAVVDDDHRRRGRPRARQRAACARRAAGDAAGRPADVALRRQGDAGLAPRPAAEGRRDRGC